VVRKLEIFPSDLLPQSREESKKKNPRKKSLSLLTRKENSCQIFRQLFHVYLRYRFFNFSKSKRFVQKYKSASLSICILIIEIRKNLKPVKVIS